MLQSYTPQDKQKFDALCGNKQEPSEVEKKYIEKTQKYIKYIKWIPGIRLVGIGNSIAMNSATQDSDIDLLIITEEKRMWLVRILCTLIFQILNVRKTDKYHAGRFCLSFFCTLKGAGFSSFALQKDPYLYFWLVFFIPILNYNSSYSLLLEKNNSWADLNNFRDILEKNKKYIKHTNNTGRDAHLGHLNKPLRRVRDAISSISTKILDILDSLLKRLFLPKTLKHYERIGKPYGIIINDDMLKFHNGDIRKKIAEKF